MISVWLIFFSPFLHAQKYESTITEKSLQSATRVTITREEIQKSSNTTVSQVLAQSAGLSIINGTFLPNSIFLRGGNSGHVLVLLDGIPVYDATSTERTFNLNSIPLSLVQQIDVLKGSQAVRYGGQALTGVISIQTVQASSELHTQIRPEVYAGTTNGSELSGKVTPPAKTFKPDLGFFVRNEKLLSPITNSTQTYGAAETGIDGAISWRPNPVPGTWLLRARNFESKRTIPGFDADSNNFQSTNRSRLVGILFRPDYEFILPKFTFAYSDSSREYDHQIADSGTPIIKEEYPAKLLIARLEQVMSGLDIFKMTLGWSYTKEKGDFNTIASYNPASNNTFHAVDQEIMAVYTLFAVPINNSEITGGYRYEKFATTTESSSYQAGYQWNNRVKMEWAEGQKAPSLFQLFSADYGNLNLKPERGQSLSAEVILLQDADQEFSFSPFYTNFFDLIQVTKVTPTKYTYTNVARAEVKGVDLAWSQKWTTSMTGLRLTYQDARDLSAQDKLLRRPDLILGGYFTEQIGTATSVTLDINGNGRRDDINPSASDSRLHLREYLLWNLSLQTEIKKSWFARFGIHNLLDDRYEESSGFYGDGRIIRVSLDWRL